jgi:hypothetical protein
MMNNRFTTRDWQSISEYLDNQLDAKSRARLEARLKENPELRQALEEMRRTKIVLRSQPRLRAPRNFTLTPAMAGIKPKKGPMYYPTLRLAFALVTVLLAVVFLGDIVSNYSRPLSIETRMASMPMESLVTEGETLAEQPPMPAMAEQAVQEPEATVEVSAKVMAPESTATGEPCGCGEFRSLEGPGYGTQEDSANSSPEEVPQEPMLMAPQGNTPEEQTSLATDTEEGKSWEIWLIRIQRIPRVPLRFVEGVLLLVVVLMGVAVWRIKRS